MHIKNIFGWSVSIILPAIYSFLFATYLTFGYGGSRWIENDGIISIVVSSLIIFILILLTFIFGVRIIKKRKSDKNGKIRMALIAVFLIVLVPIIKDTHPTENDYSWADLRTPQENAEEGFEILNKFNLNAKPDIDIELPEGLNTDNYSNIIDYKEGVLDAWDQIHIWRECIAKLNSFDGIADFTAPNDDFVGFGKIRKIARIYRAYAVLQTKQGNPDNGIKALNEIHSVVHKALPYSRYMIHNMIWTAIAINNIRVACVISVSPECKDIDLKQLNDGFKPLLKYENPFSNMFISEYLFIIDPINQEPDVSTFLESIFPHLDQEEINQSLALKTFSVVLAFLTYKENRTFTDIRMYFNHLIHNSTRYSEFQAAEEYWKLYSNRPSFTNCSGWKLLNEDHYDFHTYYIRMIKLTVENDLLTLYLQDRLGEPKDLMDCFSGEKYLKSKKPNIYYSVGLDGKAETKDDICLEEWFGEKVQPKG